LKLDKYIANLGYGTRREVDAMFVAGRITRADGMSLSARDDIAHDDIRIDGQPLDPPPGSVIMLNKPVGYVCSTTDSNPTIYELVPDRFMRRSPIIASVGRLDLDSSGLVLMTDDGKLNHRVTAPRTHLPKVYEAHLARDLSGDEAQIFASGEMLLNGEDTPLLPAGFHFIGPRHAEVTITEGRYHQVRRMFAAVGNHVVSLKRCAIGELELGSLPSGRWRVLGLKEVALLSAP
jgi:16S rRNA pseudouridine516 synthase